MDRMAAVGRHPSAVKDGQKQPAANGCFCCNCAPRARRGQSASASCIEDHLDQGAFMSAGTQTRSSSRTPPDCTYRPTSGRSWDGSGRSRTASSG